MLYTVYISIVQAQTPAHTHCTMDPLHMILKKIIYKETDNWWFFAVATEGYSGINAFSVSTLQSFPAQESLQDKWVFSTQIKLKQFFLWEEKERLVR